MKRMARITFEAEVVEGDKFGSKVKLPDGAGKWWFSSQYVELLLPDFRKGDVVRVTGGDCILQGVVEPDTKGDVFYNGKLRVRTDLSQIHYHLVQADQAELVKRPKKEEGE